MITAGTALEFTARGVTEAAQFQLVFTPGMLGAEATRVLNTTVDVLSLDVMTDDTVITGTLPWEYTANVSVRTRQAHAAASDVGAIVANAFFQASGSMPIVASGRALDVPNLSWKIVGLIAGLAILVIALKVAD